MTAYVNQSSRNADDGHHYVIYFAGKPEFEISSSAENDQGTCEIAWAAARALGCGASSAHVKYLAEGRELVSLQRLGADHRTPTRVFEGPRFNRGRDSAQPTEAESSPEKVPSRERRRVKMKPAELPPTVATGNADCVSGFGTPRRVSPRAAISPLAQLPASMLLLPQPACDMTCPPAARTSLTASSGPCGAVSSASVPPIAASTLFGGAVSSASTSTPYSSTPYSQPSVALLSASAHLPVVPSPEAGRFSPWTEGSMAAVHVTDQWVKENWNLREKLGSGYFSEVHRGSKREEPAKEQAIKVVDKGRFVNFRKRRKTQLSLGGEANILKRVRHPFIVELYECFETASHLYLILEFVPGGDLFHCISDGQRFEETQACRLFHQVCKAVAYLHSVNIIHRDLKCENILLTSWDRDAAMARDPDVAWAKLADFGVSTLSRTFGGCQTFCGTIQYIAPEVLHTLAWAFGARSGGYGRQADLWSLGVILYIVLSGSTPFEEGDEGIEPEQIIHGRFEFDVLEWCRVSPEAKSLVTGLITVSPVERLTITQALNHVWFANQVPEPSNSSSMVLAVDSRNECVIARSVFEV